MSNLTVVLFLCLAACAAPGVRPAAVTVHDIDGTPHAPLAAPDGGASVLIFITTDCPIANGYAPQIRQLAADYAGRPVAFYLVHVDPAVDAARARQHARDYGLDLNVLLDPRQVLVRRSGATITPEAAVFAGGALRYRGRINNWYGDLGRKRARVSRRELRDALDAILAGRPVPVTRTEAVGCLIPQVAQD